MIYLSLFLSFFKAGLLGFGGTFGLLAFLGHETIAAGWLSSGEFADIMALSYVVPAPAGQGTAMIGGAAAAGSGSFWARIGAGGIATAGLVLPSLMWTFLIGKYLKSPRYSDMVESVMALLRPLTPGLIAAALWMLATEENFGRFADNPWQFGISIFLFVATLVGTTVYRFNALFMIILCGIAGWLLL
ncbi:MAG TPA: chromate transporter [Alloprevotella sp.]|nr:chromate transporter [Alloprevotella sp.]